MMGGTYLKLILNGLNSYRILLYKKWNINKAQPFTTAVMCY